MVQYSFLSTNSKDEIGYYLYRASEEFGRHYIKYDELSRQPLKTQLENLNYLLLDELGDKHATIIGMKWSLDYQLENERDDEVFEWINTPRISGFCFMMIDFNKRDFSKIPKVPQQNGSISDFKPSNQRLRISGLNRPMKTKLRNYKAHSSSFAESLKADNKEENKIGIVTSIKDPSVIETPVSSDADTHKKRLSRIVNYLDDAVKATHGVMAYDSFYLILNLKYFWQNIYLYNNSLDWVESENESQIRWLYEEIKKEFNNKFSLPWISTSTTKLYQALITFIDIQWHYDQNHTKEVCAKLKTAWGRKVTNANKSNDSISLTAKTNKQLLELEIQLQKPTKAILKSLIEDEYERECK